MNPLTMLKAHFNGFSHWLLTLDQDSLFHPDTIDNAEREMSAYQLDRNIACFGVNFEDLHFKTFKKQNNAGKPIFVKALITSGCFMNIEIVKKFKFRNELFMYSVDTDFSYQLTKKGYKLVLLYRSEMNHTGGKRKYAVDGCQIHYNEPMAFYYMSRNSIYLFREYYEISSFLFQHYQWCPDEKDYPGLMLAANGNHKCLLQFPELC